MHNKLVLASLIVLGLLLIVLLIPLTAAAITNTENIAIMVEGIKEFRKGVVEIVAMAYCAAGVTVLCP